MGGGIGLSGGLEKTLGGFFGGLLGFLKKEDKEQLNNWEEFLEEQLVLSDVGLDTTSKIISRIKRQIPKGGVSGAQLKEALREEVAQIMQEASDQESPKRREGPRVFLMVGVNGAGKTTTSAKLAYFYQNQGQSVILGAADTYRSAAVEQLESWGERLGIPVVKSPKGGAPSSVAFETVQLAKRTGAEVVIIDTAGRLHSSVNLMEELSKVVRVTEKALEQTVDEVFLVLDGTSGQNTFEQTRLFLNYAKVSGLIVTKLDGTAKGGFIIGISDQFKIPVRYVGLGEKMEDLRSFKVSEFVSAIFDDSEGS